LASVDGLEGGGGGSKGKWEEKEEEEEEEKEEKDIAMTSVGRIQDNFAMTLGHIQPMTNLRRILDMFWTYFGLISDVF